MSLRFRYRLIRRNHPVTSLGGRWVRPRPIITVTLVGPKSGCVEDAVLDSGADDTIFPEALAARIGIDLTTARPGVGEGVGLGQVSLKYAQVTLRLTDGNEFREWQAWVGFTPAPLRRSLLGFAGVLQFFTAAFHGDLEEVELTVNSLYRGK